MATQLADWLSSLATTIPTTATYFVTVIEILKAMHFSTTSRCKILWRSLTSETKCIFDFLSARKIPWLQLFFREKSRISNAQGSSVVAEILNKMHFRPPHHAQDSVAVFFRKNLPASNAQDSVIVIEMLNKMHFRQPHHTQDFMIVIVFR